MNEMNITPVDNTSMSATITEHKDSFCTWNPTTRKEKAAMYNAINNPSVKIGDMVNKRITIANVYFENVEINEKDDNGNKTGVVNEAVRVILIDTDGVGYITHSTGVLNSIKAIFGAFGMPSEWEVPVTVEVKQLTLGKNHVYTLAIVE